MISFLKVFKNIPAFLLGIIQALWAGAVATFRKIASFIDQWLFESKKASYGLAVTRMLLGLTAFTLLVANFSTRLYTFGSASAWNGEITDPESAFPKIWIFSIFHTFAANDFMFTLLYIVLMLLAVLFIIGWRFRIVHPIFFVMWVSFIEMNDMVGDQSDNLFRIILILLFFADPALRWSYDARRRQKNLHFENGSSSNQIGTLLHNLTLVALTAQVIFVYGSGGLFKASGSPWEEGWAVYAPLQTMRFGVWPEINDLLTAWGPMVAVATWGSILMQVAFAGLLLSRPTRIIGLVAILIFHVSIGFLMGLPWFSLTMIAIDAIFVSDRTWVKIQKSCVALWKKSGNVPVRVPDDVPVQLRTQPDTVSRMKRTGTPAAAAPAGAGSRGRRGRRGIRGSV